MNSKARAVLNVLSGPKGKDSPDLSLLYFLAKHFAFGDVVETGVDEGYSTVALLSGISEVDRQLHSYDVDNTCIQKVATLLGCNIGDPPLDSWIFRQLPSTAASDHYQPGSVSFLFLNTSLAYEDTKDDLAVWLPKMHPDGIIAGYGYKAWEKPEEKDVGGINRAVHEFMKEYESWYQLMIPRDGHGTFVIWPKVFIGRGFGEPAGDPW